MSTRPPLPLLGEATGCTHLLNRVAERPKNAPILPRSFGGGGPPEGWWRGRSTPALESLPGTATEIENTLDSDRRMCGRWDDMMDRSIQTTRGGSGTGTHTQPPVVAPSTMLRMVPLPQNSGGGSPLLRSANSQNGNTCFLLRMFRTGVASNTIRTEPDQRNVNLIAHAGRGRALPVPRCSTFPEEGQIQTVKTTVSRYQA